MTVDFSEPVRCAGGNTQWCAEQFRYRPQNGADWVLASQIVFAPDGRSATLTFTRLSDSVDEDEDVLRYDEFPEFLRVEDLSGNDLVSPVVLEPTNLP